MDYEIYICENDDYHITVEINATALFSTSGLVKRTLDTKSYLDTDIILRFKTQNEFATGQGYEYGDMDDPDDYVRVNLCMIFDEGKIKFCFNNYANTLSYHPNTERALGELIKEHMDEIIRHLIEYHMDLGEKSIDVDKEAKLYIIDSLLSGELE